MTDPLMERFNETLFPIINQALDDADKGRIRYNPERWRELLDWISGPLTKEILYGPKTKRASCNICEGGIKTHDYTENPDARGGLILCYCGHRLAEHDKGEWGENHPFYKNFEFFSRAKMAGMLDNPIIVGLLISLARGFDKMRERGEKFLGVTDDPGHPGGEIGDQTEAVLPPEADH